MTATRAPITGIEVREHRRELSFTGHQPELHHPLRSVKKWIAVDKGELRRHCPRYADPISQENSQQPTPNSREDVMDRYIVVDYSGFSSPAFPSVVRICLFGRELGLFLFYFSFYLSCYLSISEIHRIELVIIRRENEFRKALLVS